MCIAECKNADVLLIDKNDYIVTLLIEGNLLREIFDNKIPVLAAFPYLACFIGLRKAHFNVAEIEPFSGVFNLNFKIPLFYPCQPKDHGLPSVVLVSMHHGVFKKLAGDEKEVRGVFETQIFQHDPDDFEGMVHESDIGLEFKEEFVECYGETSHGQLKARNVPCQGISLTNGCIMNYTNSGSIVSVRIFTKDNVR